MSVNLQLADQDEIVDQDDVLRSAPEETDRREIIMLNVLFLFWIIVTIVGPLMTHHMYTDVSIVAGGFIALVETIRWYGRES